MATSTAKAPIPSPRPGNIRLMLALRLMSGAYLQASNLAHGSFLLGRPPPPEDIFQVFKCYSSHVQYTSTVSIFLLLSFLINEHHNIFSLIDKIGTILQPHPHASEFKSACALHWY